MKAEWKAFLESNGAEFAEDGTVANYGSQKRETAMALSGNTFADLSHLALIAVHGSDATDFLQGQLSNDIRQVTDTHSQLTSYNTPKGRMLAIMRLFKRDNIYYLSLPAALSESILKRLRMFVLRSDVTLEDVTETFVHIGASGPGIQEELANLVGDLPTETNGVISSNECTLLHVPGLQPRYEFFGPLDCVKKIWDGLNVRCAPIGEPAWGLLNVAAGIPAVHPGTQEAFVAQMANLQAVGGVSFKKGCYPGQEVVARMQYLGKLKRRMYIGRTHCDQAPQPGDELYTPGEEQGAGKVVEAYPHPDGGFLLTAVLQIASADQGDIRLFSNDGPEVELQDPPYPLQEAS